MSVALVLGGGGVAGIAWETGIVKGLRDEGVDLGSTVALFVGTSAGSVVAAQLAAESHDVDAMYSVQARDWSASELQSSAAIWRLLVGMARVWRPFGTAQQRLARLGALAMRADVPLTDAARLEIIRARLPGVEHWPPPHRRLAITGVDCEDGAFVSWSNDSGVPLVHAVAASCAIPLLVRPQRIGERFFMDGGMQSPTNALLAQGYERVVIVAVAPRGMQHWAPLASEVAALRASGSQVTLIVPDSASRAALFPNPTDSRRRQASARAGLAQGRAEAERVRRALEKPMAIVRSDAEKKIQASKRRRWLALGGVVAVLAVVLGWCAIEFKKTN